MKQCNNVIIGQEVDVRRRARVSTPETDGLWRNLLDIDLDVISRVDDEELQAEKSRVSVEVAEILHSPTKSVYNRLRAWETLVAKMESGWSPTGTYYPEEYVHELEDRDRLGRLAAQLEDATSVKIQTLLGQLDDRFRQVTEIDDGRSVRPWVSPQFDYDQLNWRWHRKPINTPWV